MFALTIQFRLWFYDIVFARETMQSNLSLVLTNIFITQTVCFDIRALSQIDWRNWCKFSEFGIFIWTKPKKCEHNSQLLNTIKCQSKQRNTAVGHNLKWFNVDQSFWSKYKKHPAKFSNGILIVSNEHRNFCLDFVCYFCDNRINEMV